MNNHIIQPVLCLETIDRNWLIKIIENEFFTKFAAFASAFVELADDLVARLHKQVTYMRVYCQTQFRFRHRCRISHMDILEYVNVCMFMYHTIW